MAALKTARELEAALGDVPAVIRVKNLQCTIEGPGDAWGRRGKPQPMHVSADVSLDKPFGSSSSEDAVAADTVHYGLLSKAILASLGSLREQSAAGPSASLYDVLNHTWRDLTGFDLHGAKEASESKVPFLRMAAIRSLRIKLALPKASRLGGVVSLTGSASFSSEGVRSAMHSRGLALGIHELRLPVLIGVNDNERLGKQVIVTNIEVDRFAGSTDDYPGLEGVLEQAIDASSYETLEALAAKLAEVATKHLRTANLLPSDGTGSQLTIALEKPIAVPLAEAVCVELRTNTSEVPDAA
ncbi:hypothetical protein HJFPF1_00908 [Paramyrothecium foliicola]|nr:hypothetical protein HJFPF1_00908 [Paramyrothecium foliicola]